MSQHSGSQSEVPSIDVIFDLTREQLAAQRDRIANTDTKAGLVLASASLLTGALATWHVPAVSVHYPLSIQWVISRVPLISIVVYLIVIGTSFLALRPRVYDFSPDPSNLWKIYSKEPELTTKRRVRATMEEDFLTNEKLIEQKTRWTQIAFFTLALEAIIVAVILFLQTVLV